MGVSHGSDPYDIESNEKPVLEGRRIDAAPRSVSEILTQIRRDEVSQVVGNYLDRESARLMLLVGAVFRDYDRGLCTEDEASEALNYIVRKMIVG